MTLLIEGYGCGPIETNVYLVVDPDSRHALVIDAPPDSRDLVVERVTALEATVDALVLTHGHWDHIVDTAAIASALGVPVLAHSMVGSRVTNPAEGTSPVPIPPATIDQFLDEGDMVTLGAHTFQVWHLPGHDEGHIALISEPDDVFLGGDILFPNGHGRTDIPGSDQATMNRTIARLLALPDAMVVYPGHGATTTIGKERPWMAQMAGNTR